MALLLPALLLLLAVPLVVAMTRANELFVLRAQDGELRRVRGRIPLRLLDDLAAVLGHGGVTDIELRGVIEDGRPKIYASGQEDVPRAVRQQVRNVVGQWQVAAIRQAPKLRASSLSRNAE